MLQANLKLMAIEFLLVWLFTYPRAQAPYTANVARPLFAADRARTQNARGQT